MRAVIVPVRVETVEDMCKTHVTDYCQSVVGIPADAKLIDVSYEMNVREFRLCFEHESFEDVAGGDLIPFHDTIVATNYYHEPVPVGVPSDQSTPFQSKSECALCHLPIEWTSKRWYHIGAPNPPVYDHLCHNKTCDRWAKPEDAILSCKNGEEFNIFKCEDAILESPSIPF